MPSTRDGRTSVPRGHTSSGLPLHLYDQPRQNGDFPNSFLVNGLPPPSPFPESVPDGQK